MQPVDLVTLQRPNTSNGPSLHDEVVAFLTDMAKRHGARIDSLTTTWTAFNAVNPVLTELKLNTSSECRSAGGLLSGGDFGAKWVK